MNNTHALLISEQNGLGRTNLVRLCAFITKYKYFESRITNDETKSEKYFRSVLRQSCLVSGIKGSQSIIYIRTEYHSHKLLENICIFAKTGHYPNLFTEKEIWCIVNEITPSVKGTKRFERTQTIYNNFLSLIKERIHIVVSLEPGLTQYKLANLLRQHSILFTDFYVDYYRSFRLDTLNGISRSYLALQIEESRARKLKRKYSLLNDDENEENDILSHKEIQTYSSLMVDIYLVAVEHYNHLFNAKQKFYSKQDFNRIFMPKPFNVSMFKQMAIYFRIYMKRIRQDLNEKLEKLHLAFKKIDQLELKLQSLDQNIEGAVVKLDNLDKIKQAWEDKIDEQKDVYRKAVEDCRQEEKLIENMNIALEKLRVEVKMDSGQNAANPQYELALKAIQSLDPNNFNELKTYRQPPQRVLAVVNTLCLMFRQPPGWQSGKQLLLRDNFFDELIFYDKKNVPDDIFNALKQICAVETFRPEHVLPGSKAAASFCTWILAIFEFSKYERTYGIKIRELKSSEDAYNKRLVNLGNFRIC